MIHLPELHVGRPTTRGALTIFPVWSSAAVTTRGYTTGTSAVHVFEHDGQPVVGELLVTNAGAKPALILEGELLEGGWQHRVANRSVLVAAGATQPLEVSCVEHGRWHGDGEHRRGTRTAPPAVRARLADGVTDELSRQGEVWDRVSRYEETYASSPTSSLIDATHVAEGDAHDLVHGLKPLRGQVGVLVGIGGQPLLLEVFDSERTLAEAWDRLLSAAALDALTAPPVATPGRRARRLVERLEHLALHAAQQSGEGTTMASYDDAASVRALRWHDRFVHAVATNRQHVLAA